MEHLSFLIGFDKKRSILEINGKLRTVETKKEFASNWDRTHELKFACIQRISEWSNKIWWEVWAYELEVKFILLSQAIIKEFLFEASTFFSLELLGPKLNEYFRCFRRKNLTASFKTDVPSQPYLYWTAFAVRPNKTLKPNMSKWLKMQAFEKKVFQKSDRMRAGIKYSATSYIVANLLTGGPRKELFRGVQIRACKVVVTVVRSLIKCRRYVNDELSLQQYQDLGIRGIPWAR